MRKIRLDGMSDGDLRSAIDDSLRDLSGDELRVALRVLWRLAEGHEEYGVLDVEDGRDWREEMNQEIIDALVYNECAVEERSRR